MVLIPSAHRTLILLAVLVLPVIAWATYRLVPESAPVARGAAYAASRGCIACHGDPQQTVADDCSNAGENPQHPQYQLACADALAYFEASRLLRQFDENTPVSTDNLLAAGEQLARKYYCFQCHGQLGQGGFQNAGSMKGYVPGYFGNDFKLFTDDGDPNSVRKWIKYGRDPKITANPVTGLVASYFFNREAVNMPSYKSLPADELELLVNYVIALNRMGPMDAATVRAYAEKAAEIGE